MPKTETVRLRDALAACIDAYEGKLDVGLVNFLKTYGDYPIVRCGDRKVVLAVDREELEADVTDGVEVHFDEVGNITHVTYDAHAIVAAILAKLDPREVESIVEVQRHNDDSCLLCESSGVEEYGLAYQYGPPFYIAVLKPSPTSKEG